MAKVRVEVEVPEELGVDGEKARIRARVFEAWLSMVLLRGDLDEEELGEIISRVEERVWERHRSLLT